MVNLTAPIYADENLAREHLEQLLWPHGPICRHCGNADPVRITKLQGKSTRPGVYKCKECRRPFTMTVGTVMERSHIPLNKWLLAMHLMTASKKGMSAHQLHRMLGVTYQSAWFMAHRLREAMADDPKSSSGPLGGEEKVIEVDETYVGGKAKNRAYAKKPPKKQAVVALVERKGKVKSVHVANVTSETLRPILVKHASRKSRLMTDESNVYPKIGEEFAEHDTVNHSANEYVRGDAHTNTAEGYFSIFKRGIYGVYHHVSEAHLHRYLVEFDFRHNTRTALGVNDTQRAAKAMQGMVGKRLMYLRPDQAAHA
jgi:transposase-like protein